MCTNSCMRFTGALRLSTEPGDLSETPGEVHIPANNKRTWRARRSKKHKNLLSFY